MEDSYYIEASSYSSNNKSQVIKSTKCGCYYCLAIFPSKYIEEWIEGNNPEMELTAKCPYCKKDSVIGDSSGYSLDVRFLYNMYRICFKEKKLKAL